MGFNKGEWSELYTFLYLIDNPNLIVVDENLQAKDNITFKILEFILANKTKYQLSNSDKILKISPNGSNQEYDMSYINGQYKILLEKIIAHKSAKGTFEINEMTSLINDLLDGNKLKGSSKVKGDLEALIFDSLKNSSVNISYNVKSSLGSPATLLNASNHTNFIYEITNINDDIMNKNNTINTRTKLLDRCNFLINSNAKINFSKVQSEKFDFNLQMIDTNLDKILAEMLFNSYTKNEKNIQQLIKDMADNKDKYDIYQKKISDFANAVTFGMRAGEKWNGINEVNGGILLVTKTGEVYLLDLIYFKSVVDKYLINNIKLDSPSSTRYKMFEIYKKYDRYYFKLNLQIRFK